MQTFADWLRNNRDVVPGLEALEKMRAFYTAKGIDILYTKDEKQWTVPCQARISAIWKSL